MTWQNKNPIKNNFIENNTDVTSFYNLKILINKLDDETKKKFIGLETEILNQPEPQKKPKTHAHTADVSSSFQTTVLHYSIFTTPTTRIEALSQYTVVMQSADRNPAILYKLRDPDIIQAVSEAVTIPGRVYKPLVHTWAMNSVWMLAHIHRQSEFIVLSPVTPSTVIRPSAPHRYSAFAREITTAMLAGYQVTKVTYQQRRQITLLSPTKSQQDALAVTIMDCRADAQSCQIGLAMYHTSVETFQLQHPESAPVETAPIPHEQPEFTDLVLTREVFSEALKILNTKKEFQNIKFYNSGFINKSLFFNALNQRSNVETVKPTKIRNYFLDKTEFSKIYVAPKLEFSS